MNYFDPNLVEHCMSNDITYYYEDYLSITKFLIRGDKYEDNQDRKSKK